MARAKRRPPPEAHALDPLPPNTEAIIRKGPEAVVYHIPISPSRAARTLLKTTIALPLQSSWTSGSHFHTSHTEYLRLIKGSIFVELDGRLAIVSAKAGGEVSYIRTSNILKTGLEIEVNKNVRHNWGRADEYFRWKRRYHVPMAYPEDFGEEVIVEEWTDPSDISKPLFFWNLNGVVIAAQNTSMTQRQSIAEVVLGSWWVPFQLFIVFWELDNWPIFVSFRGADNPSFVGNVRTKLESMAEYMFTWSVLFAVSVLGKLLGVRAVTKERVPDDLWEAYKKSGVS